MLGSTKKAYKKQSKLYTNYKRILFMPKTRVFVITLTAWKVSKYGVFFWSFFSAFGLKTPYLDTFHAVLKAREWFNMLIKQISVYEYLDFDVFRGILYGFLFRVEILIWHIKLKKSAIIWKIWNYLNPVWNMNPVWKFNERKNESKSKQRRLLSTKSWNSDSSTSKCYITTTSNPCSHWLRSIFKN